jgi:hypothetical protein
VAVRKETIKKQFAAAIPPLLQPGEQPVAAVFMQSGVSPWVYVWSGLPGIMLAYAAGLAQYYVVLTDRRVLFLWASMISARPKGLAWADPRSPLSVSQLRPGKVFTTFRYTPYGKRSIRMNVHRMWSEELQTFLRELSPVG